MNSTIDLVREALRGSIIIRTTGLFAFWLALSGFKPGDLLVGAVAAVAATSISLKLLPPGRWTFHPVALVGLVLRFFCQSIAAGIDVARRALDPRLPLRPGLVIYRPRLPPGPTRNAFFTIMGLVPGTLPCGVEPTGDVAIHCLNVDDTVLEQLAGEEALFVRVLGSARSDG